MSVTEAVTGVPFTLNGRSVQAEEGELLIDACERNGVHIPRFCYHPRLEPVGMCRMCIVDVDTGRGAALTPSCMVPVTAEMTVETESERVCQAQDGVLELLLANHPLDCPVCDKGGECPLQDNAYAFGSGETRFVEQKRHYEKPISISPLVHLDRERCILCDRCTRFASDVAADPLIHFMDRGSQTQVNVFPDHPFSSYFSANTVQICPVGALTATPYRFKARPWDLSMVESTAVVDTTGARILLQSSQDELVRVLGVDSDAVNWGWLSDKDRFQYEANYGADRVLEPLVREGDELCPSRWEAANRAAARALRIDANRVAAIGGARLSLESQYGWAKLLKGVLGTDHVDAELGDGLPAALSLGLPRSTIAEVCQPGGVIVLMGPDPKEEAPSLYLRLRHAIVNEGASLIEITPRATSLSPLASLRLGVRPGLLGQLLAALANGELFTPVGGITPEELKQAHKILTGDAPVSVLFGRSNLAESARFTADALGALVRLNPSASFLPLLRRANIHGALEMGLTPGFLPGGERNRGGLVDQWPSTPEFEGHNTEAIMRAAAQGEIDTLLLLGADPFNDFPDAGLVQAAFDQIKTVISVESIINDSALRADIVLPAAMFGEQDGTFCNMEGRLSPLKAKVNPPGLARPDWVIAAELAMAVGPELGYDTLAGLREQMKLAVPALSEFDFENLDEPADGPLFRPNRNWELEFGDIAATPALDEKALSLLVDRKLWDMGTLTQASDSLRGLAEASSLAINPLDVSALGLDQASEVLLETGDGDRLVAFNSDERVLPGTVWLVARLAGFDVRSLISAGRSVTNVVLGSQRDPNG